VKPSRRKKNCSGDREGTAFGEGGGKGRHWRFFLFERETWRGGKTIATGGEFYRDRGKGDDRFGAALCRRGKDVLCAGKKGGMIHEGDSRSGRWAFDFRKAWRRGGGKEWGEILIVDLCFTRKREKGLFYEPV